MLSGMTRLRPLTPPRGLDLLVATEVLPEEPMVDPLWLSPLALGTPCPDCIPESRSF